MDKSDARDAEVKAMRNKPRTAEQEAELAAARKADEDALKPKKAAESKAKKGETLNEQLQEISERWGFNK